MKRKFQDYSFLLALSLAGLFTPTQFAKNVALLVVAVWFCLGVIDILKNDDNKKT